LNEAYLSASHITGFITQLIPSEIFTKQTPEEKSVVLKKVLVLEEVAFTILESRV